LTYHLETIFQIIVPRRSMKRQETGMMKKSTRPYCSVIVHQTRIVSLDPHCMPWDAKGRHTRGLLVLASCLERRWHRTKGILAQVGVNCGTQSHFGGRGPSKGRDEGCCLFFPSTGRTGEAERIILGGAQKLSSQLRAVI
jgi:hypothetical protein